MSNDSQTTLLSCPFCGNPSVIKGSELIGHGEYSDIVRCTNCSAQVSDWRGKPEDKWNRRVAQSDLLATLLDLMEQCEQQGIKFVDLANQARQILRGNK